MSFSKLISGSSERVVRASNGTKRARRIPRKGSRLCKQSRNIAVIDFGTKNCSLAYITEHDTTDILKTGIPKLPLNGTFLRVPTAILFNPEGYVLAFGHDARTLYGNLRDMEYSEYFYFEEIKMNLHHEQEVSRETRVCAANGKQFYLIDVIAQILKHLKNTLIEDHLRPSGHTFQASSFDWVITVPAIWRVKGKQLMREAGYKAGLCSKETCGKLSVISGKPSVFPNETSPDKLSLALEPESASLYCHEMLKRGLVAPHCESPSTRKPGSTYLIVDIGGGTVDVSSHKIISVKDCSRSLFPVVEELHQPVGNDCGGTQVNKEFLKFLEKLTGDSNLLKFISSSDSEMNSINKFELDEIINVAFEEQKLIFGRLDESVQRDTVIRLPPSFLEVYQDTITNNIRKNSLKALVTLERRNLRVSASQMKHFFSPAVTGILSLLSQHLQALSEHIEVIYLVGGFGGCPYLYSRIKQEFSSQCKVIVPPNPELAVVEGAILFHTNPSFVCTRRADATYGKSVYRPFDHFIHDPMRKITDSSGQILCRDLFQAIIEIGEIISPDYVYTCTSVPFNDDQKNMHIEIFSSLEKSENVWYTHGEKSGGAVKIGELVVDLPCCSADVNQREVEFTFDFSHTEIQVVGFDKSSHSQVKTIIDFLSSYN